MHAPVRHGQTSIARTLDCDCQSYNNHTTVIFEGGRGTSWHVCQKPHIRALDKLIIHATFDQTASTVIVYG